MSALEQAAEHVVDGDLYRQLVDLAESFELADWQAAVVVKRDDAPQSMAVGLSRSDCEGLILNAARQEPWRAARLFIVLRDGASYEVRELDRSRWHFPLCVRGLGRRSRSSGLAA